MSWTLKESYTLGEFKRNIKDEYLHSDPNSLTELKSKYAKYMDLTVDDCTGYFYQNGMTAVDLNKITKEGTYCHWCDGTDEDCYCLYCQLAEFCDKNFPVCYKREPDEVRELLCNRTIVAIVSDNNDEIIFVIGHYKADTGNKSKFMVVYKKQETDDRGNIIF